MQRPPEYEAYDWDDPIWHVVRLIADLMSRSHRDLAPGDIHGYLTSKDTPASIGLAHYLEARPELLEPVANHLAFRRDMEQFISAELLRTEQEAVDDLAQLTDEEVQRYGTQSLDHHQSPKVLVQTVDTLTQLVCDDVGGEFNPNPQDRAVVFGEGHVWVSPRRLDGAMPSLENPVGLWEIKEYWGGENTKPGGSKMSDAIYEIHLVGMELRMFEREHGVRVAHYAILDGKAQWASRRSDMRRAIDLVCMGLLDELIVGREVLEEWPRIVGELAALR